MEEILSGLLSLIDGYVPSGERSHQDIPDYASVAVDDVRPAIISAAVYDALTGLKNFRHFKRLSYRFRFDSALVEQNESRAEELVPNFVRDVEKFIEIMSDAPDTKPSAGP